MKVSKKMLSVCMAAGTLLCACTPKESAGSTVVVTKRLENQPALVGNSPCNFPLVSEPTTLNCMITMYGTISPDTVYVWQQYEKMTGVTVQWNAVKKSERGESVYTALYNHVPLDCIMRCKISERNLRQYGENGLILDLAKDDLLKNNAPNCWAYLQSHPDALASVMNPDGTIYALPQINAGAELRVARKIFLNKNWMERLDCDIPTTTEELYQLLKTFQTKDANGNGDPNDELPFCAIDWDSVRDSFMGAFGLANRGLHNQMFDCDETTGNIRLIQRSDAYRDFLMYLNQLYKENLLNQSIFTIENEQWQNYVTNDRVGVFASTNLAAIPASQTDQWVAIEDALEGPNHDKLWTAIRANFHSTGAAVIPATAKHPELALQWLDYFWTDEGTLFYHMGVESETFVAKDDGTFDYAPEIYEQMIAENKSFDDLIAEYSPYPGGGNPTVEIAPYFMGGEMATVPAQAARKLFSYGPKEYWPTFNFTPEENEVLNTYSSDFTKYCNSMVIDFITGVRPFSEWDAYTKQLDEMGADKLIAVYQAAADRFAALKLDNE